MNIIKIINRYAHNLVFHILLRVIVVIVNSGLITQNLTLVTSFAVFCVSCRDDSSDSEVDVHVCPLSSQTVDAEKQSSVLKSSRSKYFKDKF